MFGTRGGTTLFKSITADIYDVKFRKIKGRDGTGEKSNITAPHRRIHTKQTPSSSFVPATVATIKIPELL